LKKSNGGAAQDKEDKENKIHICQKKKQNKKGYEEAGK